jgi:endonuclease-8
VPEGDTIHRAAATLNRALAGHRVVRFESVLPALTRVHVDHPLTAMTVDRVQSAGKHILMYFGHGVPGQHGAASHANGGLVLRTHMRMSGSWHIYRPSERWRRNARDMRIVVATADFVAVGFNIPVAEFVKASDLARHAPIASLGPDALAETFDPADAVRRLRSRPEAVIADALLNQRLLAGLGNVLKCEVLFECGVDPFTNVADVSDGRLHAIAAAGRRLLQANVVGASQALRPDTLTRRTTGRDNPAERLWVYGRAGLPCRRCGTAIAIRKHGPDARLTYWCPSCQTS